MDMILRNDWHVRAQTLGTVILLWKLCKVAGWASHGELSSKQCCFMASASVLAFRFLLEFLPCHDRLWFGCTSQINPLLPKVVLVKDFITTIETKLRHLDPGFELQLALDSVEEEVANRKGFARERDDSCFFLLWILVYLHMSSGPSISRWRGWKYRRLVLGFPTWSSGLDSGFRLLVLLHHHSDW